MDYSYIFRAARAKQQTFSEFGFEVADEKTFICKKELPAPNNAFYTILTLNPKDETLTARVYEADTDEPYTLFDVPSANGAFISQIREQVQQIVNDFRSCCFETADLKDKYFDFLKTRFDAHPDYPWDDSPDAAVFRCPNNKWFALAMKIKYRQLGLSGDEELWVVNLKARPEDIPNITDKKSVFPAWHMNKKHWITVLLTAATSFENLCALTEQSYKLVTR